MTTLAQSYKFTVSAYPYPPKINLRFRLLREGEVTATPKVLRIYRDWLTIGKLDLVFWAEDGEFTRALSVDLATLLNQGEWLSCGLDVAPPRKTRAVYLALVESGTYTYNITTGEGGGSVGSPATMVGLVRVDGISADREVVVVERPINGEWRLAGFGPTPGGSGVIDVRVTDGSIYAVGFDDWGTVFAADLAVTAGQTIRPSQFSGWLYRITEGGTLPSTEPEWWAAVGENPSRPLGTARAIAVRYHQPLAHGPLPVEIT